MTIADFKRNEKQMPVSQERNDSSFKRLSATLTRWRKRLVREIKRDPENYGLILGATAVDLLCSPFWGSYLLASSIVLYKSLCPLDLRNEIDEKRQEILTHIQTASILVAIGCCLASTTETKLAASLKDSVREDILNGNQTKIVAEKHGHNFMSGWRQISVQVMGKKIGQKNDRAIISLNGEEEFYLSSKNESGKKIWGRVYPDSAHRLMFFFDPTP